MSLILVMIVGGFIGILINYFSDVIPGSRRISPPSCEVCSQHYSLKDYLLFCRCSKCGKRASTRSIIVFISAIGISILLKFFPFSMLGFWATLPIVMFLGVIMVIDIEHRLVVVKLCAFGFVLFFLYGIKLHDLLSTVFGTLAGFLIMLVFYFLGVALSKIAGMLRHKKIDEVAFGFGDVIVGTILGSLTGWPSIVGAILISILTSAAFSIVFLLTLFLIKRYRAFANTLPFTTFLIFGAVTIFYL